MQDIRHLRELESLAPGTDRLALLKQISLAGKWAPTPHASHDRHTNISTAITLLLYHYRAATPLSFPSAFTTLPEPLNIHVIRSYYQRWVLTPLRQAILVPERLMSAKRWSEIKYNRVSSACMKNHAEHFYRHDPKGFEAYLDSVEKGNTTISGATLLPHKLVAKALSFSSDLRTERGPKMFAKNDFARIQQRVVEGQWKTLISRLRESGTMENAIAICDVSGSMGSLRGKHGAHNPPPILPAISLSLVLAQLAKPPFNNGFITFSAHPKFVRLDPTLGLRDSVLGMSRAEWGMNTDLNAVFLDLILPLAIKNNVKQEDMIKRLFIFSDMQFDSGCGTNANPANWETNHDAIEKAYSNAGYAMPEIVYWNLAGSTTTPVTAEKAGVALMSGFSPSLLKVFMCESGEPPDAIHTDDWESVGDDGECKTMVDSMEVDAEEFNPVNVMKKALQKESFDGLVLCD